MGVLTPLSPTIYSMTRQFAAANATKEAAGRIFSRRPRSFDKLYHAAASVRLDFQKRTMNASAMTRYTTSEITGANQMSSPPHRAASASRAPACSTSTRQVEMQIAGRGCYTAVRNPPISTLKPTSR